MYILQTTAIHIYNDISSAVEYKSYFRFLFYASAKGKTYIIYDYIKSLEKLRRGFSDEGCNRGTIHNG